MKEDHTAQRKLRIAIIGGRGIPSTYSGTETFYEELAPRLVQRGHEVIVYCRRSLFPSRPEHYKGVRLLYLPSFESKALGTLTHTFVSMVDVLFRRVDVIFVTNVANAFHCIIPRMMKKACALNVDGIEWKRGKWGPTAKRYFYLSAKASGKILPRGIITDAFAMRQLYLEEFGTHSACITYGANPDCSTDPQVLNAYGVSPGDYYLIASRLVPENNADMIVKAFVRSSSKRLLVIAGGANYKSRFERELRAIGDPRVRFIGHVDSADKVKELHCNAYAYVHGHSMGGTNPSLLKALGYGNCVLALNTAFNAEVLGDYGVLFDGAEDLAAKIEWLEQHPAVAAEFRRRAPERISQAYTWDRIVDQYEEFFHLLCAGKNPTRIHSSVTDFPYQQHRVVETPARSEAD